LSIAKECDAMNGRIHPDGHVAWIKEIWHDGGYTEEKSILEATHSIKGRWIGWKAIMYNIENGNAVKMERQNPFTLFYFL